MAPPVGRYPGNRKELEDGSLGEVFIHLTLYTKNEKKRTFTFSAALSYNRNLKNNFQSGVSYVGNLFEPIKTGVQKQLYQDSNSLRRLIQRELQEVQRKIYPYMDEAHQRISNNLDKLHGRLMPYTDELKHQMSKGAQELKIKLGLSKYDLGNGGTPNIAENIRDQIILHTGKVRQSLYPLADNLLAEIRRAAQELHGNLSPHVLTSQEKLTLHVQELSDKLSQNAKELHEKIHKNLDDLKKQLVSYPRQYRERLPDTQVTEPVEPYVEEMAAQVQKEVEQFHRDTQQQIEHFTRTINLEMEDIKYKLSPASSNLQDTIHSIEDMQEKLELLWKDISQNLR
ncbi:apolipoprotein A-V [Gastrophryne carolinensis]